MNPIPIVENSDNRRQLVDWNIEFACKSIKLLNFFSDAIVGDHFHQEKDELFILVEGKIQELIVGESKVTNINPPVAWLVKKGQYHKYLCDESTILICLSTECFNPKDDFK